QLITDAVVGIISGTVRSAWEYGGQKCSACSRLYVPKSRWDEIFKKIKEIHKQVKLGDEIFGPILTVYVYEDSKIEEVLASVKVTNARDVLRDAVGNMYLNDKSTGSVVGQQPFGGARMSGTNDKAGGPHYGIRWTSPLTIKETSVPLTEWRYPSMD
ncbi:hypothetical protein ANCDUO_16255, partial [Ancylostoma duodenale]